MSLSARQRALQAFALFVGLRQSCHKAGAALLPNRYDQSDRSWLPFAGQVKNDFVEERRRFCFQALFFPDFVSYCVLCTAITAVYGSGEQRQRFCNQSFWSGIFFHLVIYADGSVLQSSLRASLHVKP